MTTTTNPVLTIELDGIRFAVTFDRWDAFQPTRARWIHAITTTDGELIHYGDDLTTVPATDAPHEVEALAALLTFAGADIERAEYDRRNGGIDRTDPPMFGTFAESTSVDPDSLYLMTLALRGQDND